MSRANVKKGVGIALRVFLILVAVLLIVYIAYMLIARYALHIPTPTVFGLGGASVVSGSMEPEISVGDYVITLRQDSYAQGDVIMFYTQDGVCTTHRIVEIVDGSFRTKGDANNAADLFLVGADDVVGKVVSVLPGVGAVIGFLQSPAGFCILLAVIAVVWFVCETFSRRKKQDEADGPADGGGE